MEGIVRSRPKKLDVLTATLVVPWSKYSAEHNKMFKLQEVVDELEKRHSKKYTIEQLQAWGNMMMMKKHDSHDRPPDKPFFKQKEEQPATDIRSPAGESTIGLNAWMKWASGTHFYNVV